MKLQNIQLPNYMSGVLEHNFKVFNKLSNEDFKRVFK